MDITRLAVEAALSRKERNNEGFPDLNNITEFPLLNTLNPEDKKRSLVNVCNLKNHVTIIEERTEMMQHPHKKVEKEERKTTQIKEIENADSIKEGVCNLELNRKSFQTNLEEKQAINSPKDQRIVLALPIAEEELQETNQIYKELGIKMSVYFATKPGISSPSSGHDVVSDVSQYAIMIPGMQELKEFGESIHGVDSDIAAAVASVVEVTLSSHSEDDGTVDVEQYEDID
ncbi:uncharacterized protein LOC122803983 [Protopterus annectens]|uniref:uncharacterized protein LOC122803983 n=1 Tax=Protopterus annectens TaxID=7888 RepID=UPI001CFBD69F|nr:uncharacterized protein LOC122803983 [Protopterus annectens]